jgi:hypothetical protein
VFSYLEAFLPGRHLPLRLSGRHSFGALFHFSLRQLESGFNSRLDWACTHSREYLHLLRNGQDKATSSVKSKGISPGISGRDGEILRVPKAKEKSCGCEINCGYKTTNHILGESIGKNDTHR